MLRSLSFFTLLLAALPFTAHAQSAVDPNAQDYVVPYIGYFDMIANDDGAVQFGAEYRFAPYYYTIRPAVGLNVSTDGSAYAYGGAFWDIQVTNQIFLIPNFVAGLYGEGGGKDLGGAVEFRSGIELAYQMRNQHRVGIAFNHISNAGIYDRNPGSETLLVNYHMPFGKMF